MDTAKVAQLFQTIKQAEQDRHNLSRWNGREYVITSYAKLYKINHEQQVAIDTLRRITGLYQSEIMSDVEEAEGGEEPYYLTYMAKA